MNPYVWSLLFPIAELVGLDALLLHSLRMCLKLELPPTWDATLCKLPKWHFSGIFSNNLGPSTCEMKKHRKYRSDGLFFRSECLGFIQHRRRAASEFLGANWDQTDLGPWWYSSHPACWGSKVCQFWGPKIDKHLNREWIVNEWQKLVFGIKFCELFGMGNFDLHNSLPWGTLQIPAYTLRGGGYFFRAEKADLPFKSHPQQITVFFFKSLWHYDLIWWDWDVRFLYIPESVAKGSF